MRIDDLLNEPTVHARRRIGRGGSMNRRVFLERAGSYGVLAPLYAGGFLGGAMPAAALAETKAARRNTTKPLELGLLIKPYPDPEAAIARVHELGFSNCFLSLDGYLGKYSASLAGQMQASLDRYSITATTAEVVQPGPLVWDFLDGPSTIGLVPPKARQAHMDALKQTSDFARLLGIGQIQTHCGFIPEDPRDSNYEGAVLAIRELARHCAANGQLFLMETGQETPTTMARAILDVDQPNLGVGLDTGNLILYGKGNPVDAVAILGPHVRSIHAKDGRWPTDPRKLGEEVLIGTGLVNFAQVFSGLRQVGYSGAVTIEREIDGPQQFEDVKKEKLYLEQVLAPILSHTA